MSGRKTATNRRENKTYEEKDFSGARLRDCHDALC